jgi:cardiolipin synthase
MSAFTIPNLISIFRLVLVPIVVWLVIQGRFDWAFWGFVIAGVSDGIDGWIARRFDQRSDLGAYLDPLADKALLVSLYVTLAIIGVLPVWITLLVVTRDLLIVGGVILSWVIGKAVEVKPLKVSKLNTVAQILYVVLALADQAFTMDLKAAVEIALFVVAVLTVLSGGAYVVSWLKAMSETPDDGRPDGDQPR